MTEPELRAVNSAGAENPGGVYTIPTSDIYNADANFVNGL